MSNPKKYWFTSDTHYSHRNVIKYCDRPFADEHEMNAAMISNWNRVVAPDDIVYHVGDVSFEKDPAVLDQLLSQLNGEKHLIEGNHDSKFTKWQRHFKTRQSLGVVTVPAESNNGVAQRIVLCHYAMRVWDQSHFGTWHLYGHSHGALPEDPVMRSCDVGVDVWNFTPVSMEQLNEVMSKKTFVPMVYRTAPTT